MVRKKGGEGDKLLGQGGRGAAVRLEGKKNNRTKTAEVGGGGRRKIKTNAYESEQGKDN